MGSGTHKPKFYNKRFFVSLDILSQIVRKEHITTRSQYYKWHDNFKPRYLPKYPNRTYPEWKGWNAVLHNDNSFGKEVSRKRKITRLYWDAVRWVSKQGYTTRNDYRSHYVAGDVPDDIPKHPESYYKGEWNGWGVWLGTTTRSIVMSKSEDLNMIALCRIRNQAGNMIEIISNPDGVVPLQQQCAAREDLEPFKVYHLENELKQQVTDILNAHGSSQGGNVYTIRNMHQFLFELDCILQVYVPGKR